MPSTVGIVAGSRDEFTPLDVSPYRWYDFGDLSSMQISSSTGAYIGPNGFVMNPTDYVYNGAEVQTAVTLLSDFDVVCQLSLINWSASNQVIVNVGSQAYMVSNWNLRVESNSLILEGADIGWVSRPLPAWTNNTSHWVRARRNQTTGVITLYTSEDGITWSQLGASHSGFIGAMNSTYFGATWIGKVFGYLSSASGSIQRVQIWSGGLDTGGTKVCDVDFTSPLATYRTFTYETARGARIALNTSTPGAAISRVNDKSGNGLHLTQATVANMPTIRSFDELPRPAAFFNGGQCITNTSALTQPFQVFIVARRTGAGPAYIIDGVSSGNRYYFYLAGTGDWSGIAGIGPFDDLNSRVLIELTYDTTGATKMGTQTIGTASLSLSQAPVGVNVGSRYSLTEFFTGSICELIYTPILSTQRVQRVREYLRSRWSANG